MLEARSQVESGVGQHDDSEGGHLHVSRKHENGDEVSRAYGRLIGECPSRALEAIYVPIQKGKHACPLAIYLQT
jgi:hypothetical protein